VRRAQRARRRSGKDANNQEVGAAGRLELFQETDSVQARKVMAQRAGTPAGDWLDWVARIDAGFAGVFEREDERCARGARRAL